MAEPVLADHPIHTEAPPRGTVEAAARIRFVTAASLFDGHDASINIMRRILQSAGAEVVHLGHNRSVEEVVVAALDEDAHAIAVSSYQGGHVEYFKYMADMLRERGGAEIRVFGGGGGVIIPEEMRELHGHGVTRIYSPEDGRTLGLRGMIDDMIARCDAGALRAVPPDGLERLAVGDRRTLARVITAIEDGFIDPALLAAVRERAALPRASTTRVAATGAASRASATRAALPGAASPDAAAPTSPVPLSPPVIGITGTGGSGKSSLTDEIVRRFRLDRRDTLRIAVLAIDPSRRKTGGALLGDRIRMNAIGHPNVYMRSLATRTSGREIPAAIADVLAAVRIAGFDVVIVETSGIGQGDAGIVPFVDVPVYVMTPEFGAASQLEKIDMLDFAALVAINKFDRKGAEDALRDVRKQVQRNREAFATPFEDMPVHGTIASRFNDDGVTALYHRLVAVLKERGLVDWDDGALPIPDVYGASHAARASMPRAGSRAGAIVPAGRSRYLSEIAETVRDYHAGVERQVRIARERQHLREARRLLEEAEGPGSTGETGSAGGPGRAGVIGSTGGTGSTGGAGRAGEAGGPHESGPAALERRAFALPGDRRQPRGEPGPGVAALERLEHLERSRDEALDPRARALIEQWPEMKAAYSGDEHVVRIREREIRTALRHTSLSGTSIPKVALPRFEDEGEILEFLMKENLPGHFPYTAGVFPFKREGEDPSRMFAGEGDAFRTNRRFRMLSAHAAAKRLSTAFDSVTLYGFDPARRPDVYGKVGNSGVSIATLDDMKALYEGFDLCDPATSVSMTINGPAPAILAMFLNTAIDQQLDRFRDEHGREPDAGEAETVRARALANVRGTVQADILKEDQGQNTCIFSTEFSLKVMGDIQEWFIRHRVRNFYSVSISGYHIAEAGANPISQLAFTLANGFTYVEAYLARGMGIDDFAPNLSFFFSFGMDPEYSVMGRVARRIWAVAMREKYGAGERSRKLKYHAQTSGRSLHAQEIDFNDVRTTLQALIATYDHCNSLHTNAYDEAITTPTEASVRRALAIQMIINKEWGLGKNENPNQGAFVIEELTDLVEEAVLAEFDRISERGGVLGAMETGYQRGKIQDESIFYEQKKHDGSLPIVGVNTYINPAPPPEETAIALARSTEVEKERQLERLAAFHARHADAAPIALDRLRDAVIREENVFTVLMDAVRCCSLGQITHALFEVGGQYRRNM